MGWLDRETITIYTDGSCLTQHKAGGWAAVILGKEPEELYGYEFPTTNNRMELTAAIESLKRLEAGSYVHLHTDSQYVQRGMTQWVQGWQEKNWMTVTNREVLNADLWKELIALSKQHVVSWIWVKAHAGNIHNERCDKLAVRAAKYCNQLQKELLQKQTVSLIEEFTGTNGEMVACS